MKSGIELIANERFEQLTKHGRSIQLDIEQNNHYQLSEAAGLLTVTDISADLAIEPEECCPIDWNVELWKKMCDKPYKERLIIAGALIAAEIDRIQQVDKIHHYEG